MILAGCPLVLFHAATFCARMNSIMKKARLAFLFAVATAAAVPARSLGVCPQPRRLDRWRQTQAVLKEFLLSQRQAVVAACEPDWEDREFPGGFNLQTRPERIVCHSAELHPDGQVGGHHDVELFSAGHLRGSGLEWRRIGKTPYLVYAPFAGEAKTGAELCANGAVIELREIGAVLVEAQKTIELRRKSKTIEQRGRRIERELSR